MKKITLQKLLEEYVEYRNQQNEDEEKSKAVHIVGCRQKFNDILAVMGIDSTLLKDPQNKRSYQFAECDKHLVFSLLDDFTSDSFSLMRKGKYLEVPVKSLRSYLKTFTTLLEHLDINPDVMKMQKEIMMRHTSYELAVELQKIQALMEGIKDDINQILEDVAEEVDEIRYSDSIVLLSDLGSYLHSLRERTRYLFHFMDSDRSQEDLTIGLELFRQDPNAKDQLKNQIQLEFALNKHDRYLELVAESEQLRDSGLFSRDKYSALSKVKKEMYEIWEETQIKEFGKLLVPSGIDSKTEIPHRISSEDTLIRAVEAYRNTLVLRKNADSPDDFPIAIELVAQRFHENMKRSSGAMNIHSIYKIVLAVHLDLDWDTDGRLTEAYEEYSAFSDSEQEEFDRLVNKAVTENEGLFGSFPKMYQTQLDLDIHDEIQEEISAKLELIFEAFI
ncbi:hypothetical protein [Paenibacillus sp. FSL L8-0333]|uniref:hypothetical protein n=1 Tax=Paenibacillus sp. FSL L8-0333 TaxID=2975331 RepID=UPI0030D0ECA0